MAATYTPLLFDFCVRYNLGHNIGHIRGRLDPSSTDASSQLRIKHRQDIYVGNPRVTLKNQAISYVTPITKLLPTKLIFPVKHLSAAESHQYVGCEDSCLLW